MTQPSLDSFFTAGGGRSVSWKNQPIGSTVAGVIEAVHPPQQVTDPVDGKPKFKRDGVTPIMQVRVDLETSFRNWELCKKPDDPNEVDDGRRSLYVGGWMTGAVGDALRKAGRSGPPEIGAKLAVKLTDRTPSDRPGLNPTNKFEAQYESPAAASTADFFGGGQPSQAAAPPAAPAAEPLPAKPAAISQEAWNQMPDATKRQVAQTMSATTASDQPPW